MEHETYSRILLIEDDVNLSYLLAENLKSKGFEVVLIQNGNDAIAAIIEEDYDLCILDVMLPETDGFSLAKKLKEVKPLIPFLFLTARGMEKDKFHGFELGAEDYVTKPFVFKELLYRISVIMRRFQQPQLAIVNGETSIGKLLFDHMSRVLTINGAQKKLSKLEAGLLHILLKNKGSYVTRSEILKTVWGNDDFYTAKSMDVYITRIRKLLKEEENVEVENLYGTGYRIKVVDE